MHKWSKEPLYWNGKEWSKYRDEAIVLPRKETFVYSKKDIPHEAKWYKTLFPEGFVKAKPEVYLKKIGIL